jgi:hypothetical protein
VSRRLRRIVGKIGCPRVVLWKELCVLFCSFVVLDSESIVLLLLIAVVSLLSLLLFEAGKGVGVKAKGGESGSCFQLSCLHLFSVSFV